MKKRIKVKNVIIAIIILLIIMFNIVFGIYMFNMSPVNKKDITNKEINIKDMTGYQVVSLLKEEGLIRSELFSKIYVKLKKINMQAGLYELNTGMSSSEIIDTIASGKVTTKYNISITFNEGLTVPQYARIISNNTTNEFDDIMKVFEDREYAKELIKEYWFLDESILDKKVYFPLEGYLFPNTYTFINKDVDVKTIIRTLLDEFNKQITPYKNKIKERGFTLREVVIHASIAEAESLPGDRSNIVSVNMNRIKEYTSLGSDETAYYAYKQFEETLGLTLAEFLDCSSPYNTRCTSKMGLPIGPINSPGLDALKSTVEYKETDYTWYASDCYCKTYFAKSEAEMNKKINDLKNKEEWCEISQ